MRVEALRGEGVERDVEGVRVLQRPQIIGRRWRPRCRKGAVPALVARYFVVSRATEEARDRRGDEPQRVPEPVERADDAVLSYVTSSRREHPRGLLRVRTP